MLRNPFNFTPDDPRRFIPGYRAVLLDEGEADPRVVELFKAATDDEALEQARKAAATCPFELWDALVMLGRYGPPRRN